MPHTISPIFNLIHHISIYEMIEIHLEFTINKGNIFDDIHARSGCVQKKKAQYVYFSMRYKSETIILYAPIAFMLA